MSLLKYISQSTSREKNLNEIAQLFKSGTDSDPFNEFPIAVDDDIKWEVLQSPERYRRTFKFESPREVLYFVSELYKVQFRLKHHCKIIIENMKVTVETYTHDLNQITHLDKKIKDVADDLYEDINYIENDDE